MLILGVVFFCLSFILAKVVLRLEPIPCQMSWSVISVWGIMWVVSSVFLYTIWFQPDVSISWLYWSLWYVFLAALPGMLWLNWQQIRLWRSEIQKRDVEIAVLKDKLAVEELVKKTQYYSIIKQVN